MDRKTLSQGCDFIAMGCSVGGIEALRFLLAGLPSDFSVPIGIVQHRSPDSDAMMIRCFKDVCQLKVIEPDDKEPIVAGCVYFAPANYHMLVGEDQCFHLNVDEPVQYSRPSIDVFFTSAALVFQNHLVGIVMSGANSDGAEGLKQIKLNGGVTIVQDPQTAYEKIMPAAAQAGHQVDYTIDLFKIQKLIYSLKKKGA